MQQLEINNDEEYSDDEDNDGENEEYQDEYSDKEADMDDGGNEEYQDKYSDLRLDGPKFRKEELQQLLSILPKLKKLDTTQSSYSQLYLQDLQYINSSRQLTRIEEIITKYDQDDACEEFNILAFKACLKFRSILIRLNVPYYDGKSLQVNGETSDALYYLSTFSKLKRLKVENQHDPNLTLFNIQAMLPNLMDLIFKSSFAAPVENLAIPLPRLSFIRYLQLELPNLPLVYVKHLTSGLPNCSDTLKINLTDTRFDDWLQDIREFQAYQFATPTSQLGIFEFTSDIKDGYRRRRRTQLQQEEEETNVTDFYSFIHDLTSNRKKGHCRLNLSAVSQGTRISIDSEDMYISLKYPLKGQQQQIPLPNKRISIIGHEIINHLDLNLPSAAIMTVPVDIIEFVSKNCPHMHKLNIDNSFSAGFKVIQLDTDDDNHISYDLPAAGGAGIGNSDKLVKVWMNHIEMTQDTLNRLSPCFHQNLKILITSAENRDFISHFRRQVNHDVTITSSSLDFAKLKKLKKLALDINHFIPREKKLDYLYIHVVYGEEEQGKQEEAYYEFVPETKDFSVLTTMGKAKQQQIDFGNSRLFTIHLHEKLEEFLLTGYIGAGSYMRVYARFTNGELLIREEEYQEFNWLHCSGY